MSEQTQQHVTDEELSRIESDIAGYQAKQAGWGQYEVRLARAAVRVVRELRALRAPVEDVQARESCSVCGGTGEAQGRGAKHICRCVLGKLDAARKRAAVLARDLEDTRRRLSATRDRVEQHCREIFDRDAKIAVLARENEGLRAASERRAKERAEIYDELEAVRAKRDDAHRQLEASNRNLAAARAEIEGLRATHGAVMSAICAAHAPNEAADDVLAARLVAGDLIALRHEQAQLHAERRDLRAEIERLKGELSPPDGPPWEGAAPPSTEDAPAAALRDRWLAVRWAPEARQHIAPWSIIPESERRAWRALLVRGPSAARPTHDAWMASGDGYALDDEIEAADAASDAITGVPGMRGPLG